MIERTENPGSSATPGPFKIGIPWANSRPRSYGFYDVRLPPFEPVKPYRVGIGHFLSRRIVEPHVGRLWASPNPGPCVVLQFTLPG
jgi:hypothetical protein